MNSWPWARRPTWRRVSKGSQHPIRCGQYRHAIASSQGFFECQDLGTPSLKGVTEPVRVYRMLGKALPRVASTWLGAPV